MFDFLLHEILLISGIDSEFVTKFCLIFSFKNLCGWRKFNCRAFDKLFPDFWNSDYGQFKLNSAALKIL
jgi:hypothetical protein